MPNYEIKELGLGGILDHTIRLFKDHFLFVAAVVCIFLLPVTLLSGIGTVAYTQSVTVETEEGPVISPEAEGTLLLIQFLPLPVMWLLGLMAQGALCYGIAHRYVGNEISAGEAIRHTFRRLGSLISASILMFFGVMFGMILFILPGIYLAFAWYIMIPALMFENLPGPAGLGRSRRLMKGHKIKAFVLGLLLAIFPMFGGVAAALVPEPYLSSVIMSVATCLYTGLISTAVTVIYFSARCKAEHFDLELLAQALEGPGQTTQPVL